MFGGGLPSLPPAAPAFSLPFCPHPPDPLPAGKGEIFGFLMQGAPPLAFPGLNPDGTGSIGGLAPPAPLRLSPGGTGYFLPCQCFFAPIPPTPFPRGEGGDFWFILPGAGAPGTLLQKPRGTGYTFGTQPLKYYRKHPCQCIFMKVLGGSGDSFKSPPTSPSPKKSG